MIVFTPSAIPARTWLNKLSTCGIIDIKLPGYIAEKQHAVKIHKGLQEERE
jgi:hypothetical protein